MRLVRLDEVFKIENGIASSQLDISDARTEYYTMPYLRPTKEINNIIAGYIEREGIQEPKITKAGDIVVSTDGQGSHTYSYVIPYESVCNSNIVTLKPYKELSIKEKLYYALIITSNRYRFSYGRKPKGERLASIKIPHPDYIPEWVYTNEKMSEYDGEKIKRALGERPKEPESVREYRLEDIFGIESSKNISNKEAEESQGEIPYITTSGLDNGVKCYTSKGPHYDGNKLTIAGSGTIYATFYHEKPITTSQRLYVLTQEKLNKYNALYLIPLIERNKYRYSYGRQVRIGDLQQTEIQLPSKKVNGIWEPDWEYMELYIKSLAYSASI